MARKALVFVTGAIGAAAVVAGAYAVRHRRANSAVASTSRPVASAIDNARRFTTEWRNDDTLTEEMAGAADQSASVR